MPEKIKQGLKKFFSATKVGVILIASLKDMGKWIAFAVEIWCMYILTVFANENKFSIDVLNAIMPGLLGIVQTVAILVGVSLGVDKITTKVLGYMEKRGIKNPEPVHDKDTALVP